MFLKLELCPCSHLKTQFSKHCFYSNKNMCQERFFLVLSISFFKKIFMNSSLHLKPFCRKMSALKCLKTETGGVCGRRTVRHLRGDGRCWRAAAGSHFLSINMVGTAQCDPQEGTKNTQMGSVMCFGHGWWYDLNFTLHFKIQDGTGFYHTVTACFLLWMYVFITQTMSTQLRVIFLPLKAVLTCYGWRITAALDATFIR